MGLGLELGLGLGLGLGLVQYGVPTTELPTDASVPLPSGAPPSTLVATPKSASLTCPSVEIRMFAPLMSRWITPCSCRKCSPSSTLA